MDILMPLPARDFDPTETAVPWRTLTDRGHALHFATPDGRPAEADPRMLDGRGLGPWRWLLRADGDARATYRRMEACEAFEQPVAYDDLQAGDFDGLLLPGGHAPGMKPYLESERLQQLVATFMGEERPVGAICHGVVLAARSRDPTTGRSVLHGRRTTALPRSMELSAWALTFWLGRYYRTYPQTVQAEVTEALAEATDFEEGPMALLRDTPERLDRGFTVRDGCYLSARWPGDAHRFAHDYAELLESNTR